MIYLAKFSSTAVGTGHIVQYTRTVTAVLKENNVHLGIQKDIKEGCKRMHQGQKKQHESCLVDGNFHYCEYTNRGSIVEPLPFHSFNMNITLLCARLYHSGFKLHFLGSATVFIIAL